MEYCINNHYVNIGDLDKHYQGNMEMVCRHIESNYLVDRKTSKKTYAAFDFDAARQEYEDYLDDKAAKESEKAAAKAKKIEKDTAARKSAE